MKTWIAAASLHSHNYLTRKKHGQGSIQGRRQQLAAAVTCTASWVTCLLFHWSRHPWMTRRAQRWSDSPTLLTTARAMLFLFWTLRLSSLEASTTWKKTSCLFFNNNIIFTASSSISTCICLLFRPRPWQPRGRYIPFVCTTHILLSPFNWWGLSEMMALQFQIQKIRMRRRWRGAGRCWGRMCSTSARNDSCGIQSEWCCQPGNSKAHRISSLNLPGNCTNLHEVDDTMKHTQLHQIKEVRWIPPLHQTSSILLKSVYRLVPSQFLLHPLEGMNQVCPTAAKVVWLLQ